MRKYFLIILFVIGFINTHLSFSQERKNESLSLERISKEGSWQSNFGFSEAVIAKNTGRTMYLAGVGSNADDDKHGDLLHPGDYAKQCRRVWSKIKALLESQGAGLDSLVRVRTYVTDQKFLRANAECQEEVYKGKGPYPPHTFLVISELAVPGMLIEVEATAVLP